MEWHRPDRRFRGSRARLPVLAGALLVVLAAALVAVDLAIVAVAMIIAVVFVLATLARPDLVVLGLIVALPFMIYPATVAGFSLFLAVPLFGFAAVILLLRERGAATRVAKSLPARSFAVLCAIALVMSGLSSDPAVAFSRTAYLILFGLFTAALASALASRRISVHALVGAVVLSGAIAGSALILQFLAQFAVSRGSVLDWMYSILTLLGGENAGFRNWEINDPDVLRGIFPFMTPPSAGQYLALCLVAAVWLRRDMARVLPGRSTLVGIAIVVIAVAVICTFSRQSWVGAVVGVVALTLIQRPTWLLALGLSVVAIAMLPAPGSDGSFGDYLLSASDTSTRSSSGRLAFWEEALELIPGQAAVGAGPGLFGTLTNDPTNNAAYAHNVFLDAAVELGLAGALALIAVLVIALRTAMRRGQVLAASMLVAFIAASMFDDVLYFPRNGLLLAVAFALLAAPVTATASTARERASGRVSPVASPVPRQPAGLSAARGP